MCGIAGLWERGSGRPASRESLEKAAALLAHRGPDGTGILIDAAFGVAAARLAIRDLSAGPQPWNDERLGITVVFNGEIYNDAELADELAAAGFSRRTLCDTELWPGLWRSWGLKAFPKINGAYAVAIFDRRTGVLVLARDAWGIKPLYAADGNGGVAFASEPAALGALSPPGPVDRESLAAYLVLGAVPAGRGTHRGFSSLRPGEVRVYAAGTAPPEISFIYPFSPIEDRPGMREAVSAFPRVLSAAVRRRLVGDRPAGVFLSGGVDSAAMLASLEPEERRGLPALTLDVGAPGFSEGRRARAAADALGVDLTVVKADPDDLAGFDRVLDIFDEPFADSGAPAQLRLFEWAARAGRVVMLGGDGGDELFAGYPSIRMLPALGLAARVPDRAASWLRRAGVRGLGRGGRFPARFLWEALWRGAREGDPMRGYGSLRWYCPPDLASALIAEPGLDARAVWEESLPNPALLGRRTPLGAALACDQRVFLPGTLLPMLDRIGMHFGIEARVPYLDPEVARFAWSLPDHAKAFGLATKRVPRRFLKEAGFGSIAGGAKKGLSFPLGRLLRGPWRPFADEHLRLAADSDILDPEAAGALRVRFAADAEDLHRPVWAVIQLVRWLRRRSGERVPPYPAPVI